MRVKMWTILIDATPFALSTLTYMVAWVIARRRKTRLHRNFRLVLLVGWTLTFQLASCHDIFMLGFDRGTSGQFGDQAWVDFYKPVPYVGSDGLTLYETPFHELFMLLASNAILVWLINTERREADKRLAAARQDAAQASPKVEST